MLRVPEVEALFASKWLESRLQATVPRCAHCKWNFCVGCAKPNRALPCRRVLLVDWRDAGINTTGGPSADIGHYRLEVQAMLRKAVVSNVLRTSRDAGVADGTRLLLEYLRKRRTLQKRVQSVQTKYHNPNPGLGAEKYLDTDFYTLLNLQRYFTLGLHRTKRRLRILDLGTGMGYFPYVCSLYGHDAAGLDIDSTPLYNEATVALGVTRFTEKLEARRPIAVPGKWDLITAFMICFNGHKTPELWGVTEWNKFLHNIHLHNLAEDGRVFLSFNAESENEPIAPELTRNFVTRGALRNDNEILLGPHYQFNLGVPVQE